jgi:hypothetical protein
MGRAYEMLSNPQAAESHFKNALSVIDTCSADEKTSLFHEYGLGMLFYYISIYSITATGEWLYFVSVNYSE